MFRSNKIFIYQHEQACNESVRDLRTLLTENGETIFGNEQDVIFSDFNFNMDGLYNPTFVVPPGRALYMAFDLTRRFDVIKAKFTDPFSDTKFDFNYIGICAGGFLGPYDAEFFEQGKWSMHSREAKIRGIYDDVQAIGPFSPRTHQPSTKQFTPYMVTLDIADSKEQMTSMYVDGPAFLKRTAHSDFEVIATYADKEEYDFSTKQRPKTYSHLAAVVRSKTVNHGGGVFMSGVHVESSVRDSQFLRLFTTPNKEALNLSREDVARLEADREQNEAKAIEMLRETFYCR